MPRLLDIIKGTRQIRRVEIPLKNMNRDGEIVSVFVGLRILTGDDYARALEYATKFANNRNAKAEPGVEAYDYGKAVATVALACVDVDSSPDNPVPFFGTAEMPSLEERANDVLKNPLIGRDTILYLAECQDVWQDECSPQPGVGERTPEEYFKMIAEVVAEGPLAFLRLSAGSRLKFLLFTANLLLASQTLNSTSGSQPSATLES